MATYLGYHSRAAIQNFVILQNVLFEHRAHGPQQVQQHHVVGRLGHRQIELGDGCRFGHQRTELARLFDGGLHLTNALEIRPGSRKAA